MPRSSVVTPELVKSFAKLNMASAIQNAAICFAMAAIIIGGLAFNGTWWGLISLILASTFADMHEVKINTRPEK